MAMADSHAFYMTTLIPSFRLSAIWLSLADLSRLVCLSKELHRGLADPTLWRISALFAACEATFGSDAGRRRRPPRGVSLLPRGVAGATSSDAIPRCFRGAPPSRASVMWNPTIRAVASASMFIAALKDFVTSVRQRAVCGARGEEGDFVAWWNHFLRRTTAPVASLAAGDTEPHTPLVPRILRGVAPSAVAVGLRSTLALASPFAAAAPTGDELGATLRRTGGMHPSAGKPGGTAAWAAVVAVVADEATRTLCADYDWLVRCVAGVERIVYSTGGDLIASWPWIRAMVEVELRCSSSAQPPFERRRIPAANAIEEEEEEEEEELEGDAMMDECEAEGRGEGCTGSGSGSRASSTRDAGRHAAASPAMEEEDDTASRTDCGDDDDGGGGGMFSEEEEEEEEEEDSNSRCCDDEASSSAAVAGAPTRMVRHRTACTNLRKLTLADVESVILHRVASSSNLLPPAQYCCEGVAVMRLGRSAANDFFVLTIAENGALRSMRCAFATAPTAAGAYVRLLDDPHGQVLSERWRGELAYLEQDVTSSIAAASAKRPLPLPLPHRAFSPVSPLDAFSDGGGSGDGGDDGGGGGAMAAAATSGVFGLAAMCDALADMPRSKRSKRSKPPRAQAENRSFFAQLGAGSGVAASRPPKRHAAPRSSGQQRSKRTRMQSDGPSAAAEAAVRVEEDER